MSTTTYMQYTKPFEKAQAETLVSLLLERDYTVSVNDGEEWTVKKSADRGVILEAMGSTDSDTLRARSADGQFVADFVLIYGNGPGELIADHTANDAAESLWAAFAARHPLR